MFYVVMRVVKYLELKEIKEKLKLKCSPLFLDSAIGDTGDRCRKASVHRSPAGEDSNKSVSTFTLCLCVHVPNVCV